MTTIDLWREALTTLAVIAAPFLIACLITGLAVALLQTATQIQENVITFVPKLVAALLVIALGGNIMLDRIGRFASRAISRAGEPSAERTGSPGPDPRAAP